MDPIRVPSFPDSPSVLAPLCMHAETERRILRLLGGNHLHNAAIVVDNWIGGEYDDDDDDDDDGLKREGYECLCFIHHGA